MEDYNELELKTDYAQSLTACMCACIELATALEAQTDVTPTHPRHGTLLSVRNDIREVLAKLPAPVVATLTETEMIEQAAMRG